MSNIVLSMNTSKNERRPFTLFVMSSMLTKIAELYINFGEVNFLSDHAVTLQAMLVNLVGEVSPRGQAYVSLVTEALLKRFPSEGSLLLLRCGILKKFVDAYALFYSDSKESEPDCVIILYLTTLARAILASPELSESCDLFVSGGIFGVHELVRLPYFQILPLS